MREAREAGQAVSAVKFSPALQSEVSSQVIAIEPALRGLFNMDEIPISGEDLERLLTAVWIHGYSQGVEECLGDVPRAILEAAEADGLT